MEALAEAPEIALGLVSPSAAPSASQNKIPEQLANQREAAQQQQRQFAEQWANQQICQQLTSGTANTIDRRTFEQGGCRKFSKTPGQTPKKAYVIKEFTSTSSAGICSIRCLVT
ncbi:unnamed protein product, partial [Cyprideis torosa]